MVVCGYSDQRAFGTTGGYVYMRCVESGGKNDARRCGGFFIFGARASSSALRDFSASVCLYIHYVRGYRARKGVL